MPFAIVDLVREGEEQAVIKNIKVQRDHPMDLRRFNVSMCAMVSTVDDDMLTEWLVYHIMQGVEHFYLFDNRKTDSSLEGSSILPFLEANIVTLIYYPWAPERARTFEMIQRTTFAVMLQRFGHLNEYVGFIDVDEFVLPGIRFHPSSLSEYSSLLPRMLKVLDWDPGT